MSMAAVAEVTITPGTGTFDPADQRWAEQVALLTDDLREAAGSVSRRRIPEPGAKGAAGEVILALGSAGAVTAAVECFRAWLRRDKTRTLTVTWPTVTGPRARKLPWRRVHGCGPRPSVRQCGSVFAWAAQMSDRTGFRLAAYELMRLFDEAVNIPLTLGMLITGLVVSLRGTSGLRRHWWATVTLLLSLPVPIATVPLSVPRVQSMQIVAISLGTILVLNVVISISVFTPWGRAAAARRPAVPSGPDVHRVGKRNQLHLSICCGDAVSSRLGFV
ncbi:MAG: effector-associated constant component EACC1 [Pseudonocardiaceae bacterium]